ncbi:uncharacterized protein [Fopius arisanus]|uniref:LITAF domain-containing protein n=2 Tax=Fopius arisanus TaxID=64838 RepID=A0A9R1T5P5_9HYME|nr:PREDICTED: uncharacterized protein LOC105266570 [Fopius arisanus]
MGKSKNRECNLKKWSSTRKSAPGHREPASRTIFSTKVETWRSHGEEVYCPICKKPVVPVVLEKRRRVTSSGFAAICLLGCWPLCAGLFPLKADSSTLEMRCPVCSYQYRSLHRVKEISPSKASSTSTLPNTRDSHHSLNTQMKTHPQRGDEVMERMELEIDGEKNKMGSASVRTHHAIDRIGRIDLVQPSDGCECLESTDISGKVSSYRLVEQFEYYRHQHNSFQSPECGFYHHRCNQRSCPHDTKFPMPLSHEESAFHAIEHTGYHDSGLRRINSLVFDSKNRREFTSNEDRGYNHIHWTGDDCRISQPENTCCQGRVRGGKK